MSTYDLCGRPQTSTDPLGHATTTSYYDASSPYAGLISSVATVGNNARGDPDDLLHVLRRAGANGRVDDPKQNSFSSSYDPMGNLTHQSDGAPVSQHPYTVYGYDGLGRKASITYGDGTTERWQYDASGNVSQYQNRGGDIQSFAPYDQRNRPVSWTWNNPNNPYQCSIGFDAVGRCTSMSNGFSTLGMNYDFSGVPTSESQAVEGTATTQTVTYTPDADGTVSQVGYPSGYAALYDDRDDLDDRLRSVSALYPGTGTTPHFLASYGYQDSRCTGRLELQRGGDRLRVSGQQPRGPG